MRKRRDYGLKQDKRGIWHASFSVAGVRLQRRSTFTDDRKKAEEWCATAAARLWREVKLGEAPALTWEQAVLLWTRNKQANGKRDLHHDMQMAAMMGRMLNFKMVSELSSKVVEDALDYLDTERGWSNATRNRHRSFVLGVLNHARKKGYEVPRITAERYDELARKVRFLYKEEAARLLAELPLHLQRMAAFSLMTGLRQSNVTGLEWKNVSFERRVAWVDANDAKGKRTIQVPLSDDAIALLKEAAACEKHGHERVAFTYFGALVEQPANSAWKKALVRAKIDNFRWHDLRHTWASWHVMGWMHPQGTPTPLPVLQTLGGWRSYAMVQKYAHLCADYTAQFVGSINLTACASGTTLTTGDGSAAASGKPGTEARPERRAA